MNADDRIGRHVGRGDRGSQNGGCIGKTTILRDLGAEQRDQRPNRKGVEMCGPERIDGKGNTLAIRPARSSPLPDRKADERRGGNHAEQEKAPRTATRQKKKQREDQIELLFDRQGPQMAERRPCRAGRVIGDDPFSRFSVNVRSQGTS